MPSFFSGVSLGTIAVLVSVNIRLLVGNVNSLSSIHGQVYMIVSDHGMTAWWYLLLISPNLRQTEKLEDGPKARVDRPF